MIAVNSSQLKDGLGSIQIELARRSLGIGHWIADCRASSCWWCMGPQTNLVSRLSNFESIPEVCFLKGKCEEGKRIFKGLAMAAYNNYDPSCAAICSSDIC